MSKSFVPDIADLETISDYGSEDTKADISLIRFYGFSMQAVVNYLTILGNAFLIHAQILLQTVHSISSFIATMVL